MGNEAFRASRHSATSTFRRSSRRRSKSTSSNNGQNYLPEDEVDRPVTDRATNNIQLQDFTTPKPQKRMDKLRRSLTFRRKKKSDTTAITTNSNTKSTTTAIATTGTATTAAAVQSTEQSSVSGAQSGPSRPHLWIEDEKKVRTGNCSFQVKYLGYYEVSDSRGMHICEQAIEKLINESKENKKKQAIKAILYVSGDSLRVVDESNKTLLVDQTIEKVSFCAPDRHHENGFAYICRDGTARRWLCHGFLAIKDTLKGASSGCTGGERLSHAVGCAFSVCLEKKQKRERENVSMEVGPNHSFTRFGSFRQASLTERFEDPQMVIPAVEPVPIKQVENPHAIERPKPSQDVFMRQNSLRGSQNLSLPFKRTNMAYQSLRPGELPSYQQKTGFLNITTNTNNNNHSQNSSTKLENNLKEIPEVEASVEKLTLNDWANFVENKPSVFNTPTSLPITPQQVLPISQTQPPPLPPIPAQYLNLTPNQSQVNFNLSTITTTTTATATNLTTSFTPNQNETFEQKWARLQAAKNTNPFAEDIAKKYEIKL